MSKSERPQEKCGIFGVFGQKENNAAYLTSQGLFALQHRGQEGSGITSTDGTELFDHRQDGLVAQVYGDVRWDKLPGTIAIGHNRYGTSSKRASHEHIQPVLDAERTFSLAHNGNIPDTTKLENFLAEHDIFKAGHNDSEMMHATIAHYVKKGAPLEEAIVEAQPLFTGVYSLLLMNKEQMIAVRDPNGIRPLAIGRLGQNYIFSSETCALDTIEARYTREVKPGEMVIVDANGLRSTQLEKGQQHLDAFEFVYFSRPDSKLAGKSVQIVREEMGKNLAKEDREYPINADMVIAVPDSGTPAAIGYAEEAGLPYKIGFINNRYSGRTFITPEQKIRASRVARKLNPIPEVVKGKSIVVVDDSIVRGTTAQKLVSLLRKAGAKEIHLRSTSPEVKFPDFYGIDTPLQKDLLAAGMNLEEMRAYLGSDSLRFLSVGGMVGAIGIPQSELSTACFTGDYPVDIGKRRSEVIFSE